MKSALAFFACIAACITAQPARAGSPAAGNPGLTDPHLRSAIEKALYSLTPSGHGTWSGVNDAQRMSVEFNESQARLTHPGGSVGFRLAGYGYGDKLRAPRAPQLVGAGTRLEYRRGDFTEWYVNGPSGLEQGFTLRERPGAAGTDQPLEIALDITGDLALSQEGAGVLLKSGETVVLRYAGLTAFDARGRAIPAHMEARGSRILIAVRDRDAQYPLTIDPLWTEQMRLLSLATDHATGDSFGYAVAVSGTTVAVGAYGHSVNGQTGAGAVYIFTQSGSSWSLQQELTASDESTGFQQHFGAAVALSGDTVVIGAPERAVGGTNDEGEVYVFTRTAGVWSEKQQIFSPDPTTNSGDSFGNALAFDGTSLLIGAPFHSNGGNSGVYSAGAAYIYTFVSGSWTEQQELAAVSPAELYEFGYSVALSGDIALVGRVPSVGAVQTFQRSGSTWSAQTLLAPSDAGSNDDFGAKIAVNGTTAMVGSPGHTVGGNDGQGAVYVYTQSGSDWTQQVELSSSDGAASDAFGSAVAYDGTSLAVGAPSHKVGSNANQGAGYIFTGSGATWTQTAELVASDGTSNQFLGTSISVSGGLVEMNDYVFAESASLSISATHSNPIFQSGPGVLTLTVTNTGGLATEGTAMVTDTVDSAFTIDSASSGCTISGQAVTCTLAAGSTAATTVFTIYVTASSTAGASIGNTPMLSDSSDNVSTGSSSDTIAVTSQAPIADSKLTQITLSGSTDNGSCAGGNRTLTATDLLQDTGGTTLTNPYAANVTLSGGNTLNSQSASVSSVMSGGNVTFTFHIQLATCNTFSLSFDVRSN